MSAAATLTTTTDLNTAPTGDVIRSLTTGTVFVRGDGPYWHTICNPEQWLAVRLIRQAPFVRLVPAT